MSAIESLCSGSLSNDEFSCGFALPGRRDMIRVGTSSSASAGGRLTVHPQSIDVICKVKTSVEKHRQLSISCLIYIIPFWLCIISAK
jgi:hypothetical protein